MDNYNWKSSSISLFYNEQGQRFAHQNIYLLIKKYEFKCNTWTCNKDVGYNSKYLLKFYNYMLSICQIYFENLPILKKIKEKDGKRESDIGKEREKARDKGMWKIMRDERDERVKK